MMPLVSNIIRTQWKAFRTTHPLKRGSIAYALLWPTSSLVQQSFEGKNFGTYEYTSALRFGILGSLYVAPALYVWVRVSSAMWPQMSLRIGLLKAAVEQVSFAPFIYGSFFAGMTLLEGKPIRTAMEEVKNKFIPTYKVGLYFWPILQTINFSMVPERHRLVYLSLCSLMWTIFLAYMKKTSITEETPFRIEEKITWSRKPNLATL
ncbi:mpv17-like protein [Stomoxys calcitrans]|uniref:mpv17-like protein n=1 Tax=Stomoxys calcitrans TaxID=35570 RepID=UPI0027E2DEB4|nr:mpv17-like protein [Stomoxys calcitrans]XP_059223604.1 mpv17-like protein [Stomoxys calcitrans]